MITLTQKEYHRWLDLKAAAEEVIANWEQGDLAAAVRWLNDALDALPKKKP